MARRTALKITALVLTWLMICLAIPQLAFIPGTPAANAQVSTPLKLLFVPIFTSSTEPSYTEFYNAAWKAYSDFMQFLPLTCDASGTSCTTKYANRFSIYVPSADEFNRFQKNGICPLDPAIVRQLAIQYGYDPAQYNIIVGVGKRNKNALGQTTRCMPDETRTYQGLGNGLIWFDIDSSTTFSHEMGHIFGLDEQYCSKEAGSTHFSCNSIQSPNPMFAGLGCDPAAVSGPTACCGPSVGLPQCDAEYRQCCLGNKVGSGRSIMGAGLNRVGYDPNELEQITSVLESIAPISTYPGAVIAQTSATTDIGCAGWGGTCTQIPTCTGFFVQGQCSGAATRQCCVPTPLKNLNNQQACESEDNNWCTSGSNGYCAYQTSNCVTPYTLAQKLPVTSPTTTTTPTTTTAGTITLSSTNPQQPKSNSPVSLQFSVPANTNIVSFQVRILQPNGQVVTITPPQVFSGTCPSNCVASFTPGTSGVHSVEILAKNSAGTTVASGTGSFTVTASGTTTPGTGTQTSTLGYQTCSDCKTLGAGQNAKWCIVRNAQCGRISNFVCRQNACLPGEEDASTCPDLCQEQCQSTILSPFCGSSSVAAISTITTASTSSLGIPVGTCSATSPISYFTNVIGQNYQQYVQSPTQMLPGTLCSTKNEYCWCTSFKMGTAFTSNPTTTQSTIPGTTRTKNWENPNEIADPPSTKENDLDCDQASGATIRASIESTGIDKTKSTLFASGQQITITGEVAKFSSTCNGYVYTCTKPEQFECDIDRGFWSDSWEYQNNGQCSAGTTYLYGEGAPHKDRHWSRIGLVAAMSVLTAVSFGGAAMGLSAAVIQGISAASIVAITGLSASLCSGSGGTAAAATFTSAMQQYQRYTNGAMCTSAGGSCKSTCSSTEQEIGLDCPSDKLCCLSKNSPSTGSVTEGGIAHAQNLPSTPISGISSLPAGSAGTVTSGGTAASAGLSTASMATLAQGAYALSSCTPALEQRVCYHVCGKTYQTKPAGKPVCISADGKTSGGAIVGYRQAQYACTKGSCGGFANEIVFIQVRSPTGAVISTDSTKTDANGKFSYTLIAPNVDGKVTVVLTTNTEDLTGATTGGTTTGTDTSTTGTGSTGGGTGASCDVPGGLSTGPAYGDDVLTAVNEYLAAHPEVGAMAASDQNALWTYTEGVAAILKAKGFKASGNVDNCHGTRGGDGLIAGRSGDAYAEYYDMKSGTMEDGTIAQAAKADFTEYAQWDRCNC
jgi:hypothetical protein